MNIQLQKHADGSGGLVRVTVSAEDYWDGLQKRVRDASRKAHVQGFRLGHVPVAHILRLYGQSLLLETLNEVVQQSLTEYLEREDFKILGEPLLVKSDPLGQATDRQDYHFNYEIGLQQEPSLDGLDKRTFTRYVIQPTQEDVDDFTENLRDRFGTTTHPDRIVDSDVLLCGELQLDDKKTEELTLSRAQMLPEASARLADLATGSSISFAPDALYASEALPAGLLRLQKQGVDLSATYSFQLKRIDLVGKASIDEQLFAKVYPSEEIKSKEAFFERCKRHLGAQYALQSHRFLQNQIKSILIKDFSPPLPKDYLKKRFDANIPDDQKFDEQTLEAAFQQYQDNLRWRILQAHASDTHHLRIEPEALQSEVERLLLQQAQVHGEPTPEQRQEIQPFVNQFLSKKSNTESIYVQMQEEKVLNYVIDQVILKDEPVTTSAFHEVIQKESSAA